MAADGLGRTSRGHPTLESLSSLPIFVHAAETRSFTQAGRKLGLSASAVGKAITRLEAQLGVRLFHRSTRSISLTTEGELLLESSRRILLEISAVERELAGNRSAPRGKLRVSLPALGDLFNPALAAFIRKYPEIELDIDLSDRLVDIIDEGFDVAVRTGEGVDSRLMTRTLGVYRLVLVGSPDYFKRTGVPLNPGDLGPHICLHHRFPSTGKLERWPFKQLDKGVEMPVPVTLSASTLEPLIDLAERGVGIACVPDFTVSRQVSEGRLVRVLDGYLEYQNVFRAVWPSGRHVTPRLRVFLDYLAGNLFQDRQNRKA